LKKASDVDKELGFKAKDFGSKDKAKDLGPKTKDSRYQGQWQKSKLTMNDHRITMHSENLANYLIIPEVCRTFSHDVG